MSATTQPTATDWPDGVIARYLTVGGATVDIAYDRPNDHISATCTGELCPWQERTCLDGMTYDTPEESQERFEQRLPVSQRYAQEHAAWCRAMPKPEAGPR